MPDRELTEPASPNAALLSESSPNGARLLLTVNKTQRGHSRIYCATDQF
jgi:hypothetical protein